MSYRVGVVGYLNAKPLTWALERGEIAGVEVVSTVPAALAGMLLEEQLDAALVSSVVALEAPALEMLPEAGCIAADGPVQSVLLLTKVHITQIRRVALDASSLSSVALVRILLAMRYGLRPEYVTLSPHLATMLEAADAALLIGDPGLSQYVGNGSVGPLYDVLDLGRAWHDWTGLPFVFAGWTVRSGVARDELAALLLEARERSRAEIGAIAADAAVRLGLSEEVCRHYLECVVRYEFGERERQGYELFGSFLRELESL